MLADSEEDPATMDNHANRPEILAARSHGHGITTRFSDTVDKEMMYYALPVKKGSLFLGYVRASLPLSVIDDRLSHVRTTVLVSIAMSILVALILGFIVARGFAKPLTAMTAIAESMSSE